jgi:hypothetical protein
MRRIKEVRWKRKCVMCEEVNSAWIEITVKKDGPNKHIVCKPCLTKVLSLEHWGIKIHRIAKKWSFPEWMINIIKNGDDKR